MTSGTTNPAEFKRHRLWFVDPVEPDLAAYSPPILNRVRGPLDPQVLRLALRRFGLRHEPAPDRGDRGEPELELVSVEHEPAAERDDAAATVLLEQAAVPFDLADGPLVRVTLIRMTPEDHFLLLTLHPVVADTSSRAVLVDELSADYAAALAGEPGEITPSTVNHHRRQQDLLSGGTEPTLPYWRERLSGSVPVSPPADRPPPPVPSGRSATITRSWSGPVAVTVRERSRQYSVLPFVTLLAGFAGVLARCTGQSDLTLATSTAGLSESDRENGPAGFAFALRAEIDGEADFETLLRRVAAELAAAADRPTLPLDLLADQLDPDRDLARPPLAGVLFQAEDVLDRPLVLPGLEVELVDFTFGTMTFDLVLGVRSSSDRIQLRAQYSTDRFDAETVDDLLAAYRTYLSAALADGSAALADLPLLAPDQAARMLLSQNDTAQPLPHGHCLHEPFEWQAARTPNAVAAISSTGRHTFCDLNERANQIAHELRELGVSRDTRVALCLPRGVDLMVATLAVLKAGGAFVPVDPEYPAARIEHMLNDSQARVVLTRSGVLPAVVSVPETVAVLALDEAADRIADRSTQPPARQSGPDDLGYVIYTSGSTGVPKGIALRHRGVMNNILDLNQRFGIGTGDRVLALSSPSFDMSVFEVLGVPGAGGTVVLPDPDRRSNPGYWLELIADHGITVWNSVPALLALMLDAWAGGDRAELPSLRVALLGGDWIPVTLPDRFRAAAPGVRVISLGGATEASIHSTVFEIEGVDPTWTSIPYGRPLANQLAVVLDDRLHPVPIGVPGQLYLGGVGLAAGYLGAAAAANDRFVTRTLPGLGEQRLYLTGDRARWRRTGELELIGRIDAQVKLNGVRIELGEVETALRTAPGVQAAAAALLRAPSGETVLVGYVVPAPDAPDDALDLDLVRSTLEHRLPASMRPSRLVRLEALPLSPNGKIDRRALPWDGVAGPPLPGGPEGPTEERVAAAWRQLLGLAFIGRRAEFFDLGGTTFQALRSIRALDPGLSATDLLRHLTVSSLAAAIDRRAAERAGHSARLHPLREPAGATHTLVCLPYAGADDEAYQPLADALPDGLAVWSVARPEPTPEDRPPVSPAAALADVADEIGRFGTPVLLYGHGSGAAPAVALGRELQRRGVPVTGVFLAAALPDPDPSASADLVIDGDEDQILTQLDRLGRLDQRATDRPALIARARYDLVEAVRFFLREQLGQNPPDRLAAGVHVLVGQHDPSTAEAATRYREWQRYGDVISLTTVPGAGHYLIEDRPAEVARVIGQHLS